MFMKILHYSLFYSSKAVTNYLYSKDIDPNTVLLNDYNFMERIMYITVSKTNNKIKRRETRQPSSVPQFCQILPLSLSILVQLEKIFRKKTKGKKKRVRTTRRERQEKLENKGE